MIETFTHRTRIEQPASTVFDWHKRPGAIERLTPPWDDVAILERIGTIRDGDRVRLRVKVLGVPMEWLLEHRDYVEGQQFRDLQLKGPFAYWQHTHRVESDGAASARETACEACWMIDEIEYELPLAQPGAVFGGGIVKERLARMFAYRHRVLAQDLADHARLAAGRTLSVAVSGASGLIGSSLIPLLSTGGHTIKRLVRREAQNDEEVTWFPVAGAVEAGKLEGIDAVVHLAGENLFGRWSEERKGRLRASRVQATRGLCESLAGLQCRPSVLVAASAIGIYGDRGGETLTEASGRGTGFLADLCADWEEATQPASEAGIRVVNLRFGVVLSPRGGALKLMLPVFRSYLGGVVGDGSNWMSWVSIEDVGLLVYRSILDGSFRGPINAVAPAPVTQRELVRTLASVLDRPAGIPVPRFLVRAAAGELGDEVLASQKVLPARVPPDHPWRHPVLEQALRQLLGRCMPSSPMARLESSFGL